MQAADIRPGYRNDIELNQLKAGDVQCVRRAQKVFAQSEFFFHLIK